MNKFDCILIPGGGLLEDGGLPPWTRARLEKALDHLDQAKWIGLLSGGTVHKPPPLDQNGFPLYESRVLAKELIACGVNPDRILTEICSFDTIGNAYFSRMLFADPLKLSSILVITSDFHMARTREIFDWVYSLRPVGGTYQIKYATSPDHGLSTSARTARVTREKQSLSALQETKMKISSLEQFHSWIYREHKAYAPALPPDPLSADELKSY